MSDSGSTILEDRLRATYRAVTTSTQYSPPPPIGSLDGPVRHARGPKRLVVAVGAFAAILAIVVAVVAVNTSDDATHLRKRAPSEQPLFPDVVTHDGPELLLSPQTIPAEYQLVFATGPDDARNGVGSFGVPTTTQYWVHLDPSGTRPQSGFTITWGPANLADAARPPGMSLPLQGDALDQYRNSGTPITIAGHDAFSSPLGVAWEQNDQLVVVGALTDGPMGNWPAHLTPAEVEAIAAHVVRDPDGTYQLTDPPAGYRLAGHAPDPAMPGTNERRLVYSDGNGHGFAVQLMDNTEAPPGVALSWPRTQLVTVRDQSAVLAPFLNGGDGSGCATIDAFLCSVEAPVIGGHTYLQWLEPDSTRVTITAVGLTDQQVLDIGRSLASISPTDWKQLTDVTATIPCALTARCRAN